MAEAPPATTEVLLTDFIVSDDIERSRRFYTEVLGGRVVFSGEGGEPTNVALSNSWDRHQRGRRPYRRQAIGHPGDATQSRPRQQLPQHPGQGHRGRYRESSAWGANCLTPPKQHQYEIRFTSATPTAI